MTSSPFLTDEVKMPADHSQPYIASSNPSQFQKGQSGNPAGRPRGSRNKATLAAESLLEGELERLTREAIDRAMDGDPLLLRLCITRLMPAPRGRRVQLDLPAGRDIENIAASLEATVRAVAEGVISPLEATDLAEVIELQRRTIETVDLERRLAYLEEVSGDIAKREAKQLQGEWDDEDDNGRRYTEADLGPPLATPQEGGPESSRSGA
jgi:hypothetical protein